MNPSKVYNKLRREHDRMLRSRTMNTALVKIDYDAAAAGVDYDANVEGSYPDVQRASMLVYGTVHFVNPVKSDVRIYAEVENGDVIIDFPPETELPVSNPEFSIEGHEGTVFVQKDAGKELSAYWDLIVGGRRVFRTVLLGRQK